MWVELRNIPLEFFVIAPDQWKINLRLNAYTSANLLKRSLWSLLWFLSRKHAIRRSSSTAINLLHRHTDVERSFDFLHCVAIFVAVVLVAVRPELDCVQLCVGSVCHQRSRFRIQDRSVQRGAAKNQLQYGCWMVSGVARVTCNRRPCDLLGVILLYSFQ